MVSLCECLMSSVCDSSVNTFLRVPKEMQNAAVACLTHPSACAHFCTHNATLHFCTQRPHGILRGEKGGGRERAMKTEAVERMKSDRKRRKDGNGVRQQQRDPV